ncbi:Thiolase, N-terminal domain-containing protein [Dipodascopsis tothii]|uniref:Thiolase, N-terminal domain-containing protein n=1 Tax=Dipodascopsis tothii TaxID=44089 RepID=UPI0034CF8E63
MIKRGLGSILGKAATDVVIVSALRTPFTKATRGGLANMSPEELLSVVLDATIKRTGVDPAQVQDVLAGAVLQTLSGQKATAMAVKHAGFPFTTTVNTINRQCSSSAQAVSYLAGTIRSGAIDCGLAAGVESMTADYFPHRGIPTRIAQELKDSPFQEARDVLMPMGITSENVAAEFGISRDDQDVFGAESHRKTIAARESGYFEREIVPVLAREVPDPKAPPKDSSEPVKWVTVSQDDGVRAGITVDKLAKLKPAFSETGTTTAGNSSQITDGASALLLMTRAKAEALGMQPIGKFVTSTVAGVPARIMGIAPSVAVPALLDLAGLSVADVDIFELNEAFASQSLYCIRMIGVDPAKVNPHGGAIAIGHPLGATGGRCIATLLNGLRTTGGKVGVVSMCASTGQGYAGLFVAE